MAVRVPPQAGRGVYVKGSEGFTLASCAALLEIEDGAIAGVRVVLGGVAHRPWRSRPTESALVGQPCNADVFSRAAEAALGEATVDVQTAFRLALLRGVIVAALEAAHGLGETVEARAA